MVKIIFLFGRNTNSWCLPWVAFTRRIDVLVFSFNGSHAWTALFVICDINQQNRIALKIAHIVLQWLTKKSSISILFLISLYWRIITINCGNSEVLVYHKSNYTKSTFCTSSIILSVFPLWYACRNTCNSMKKPSWICNNNRLINWT